VHGRRRLAGLVAGGAAYSSAPGGLASFAAVFAFDSLRGLGFLRWLRGSHEDRAARLASGARSAIASSAACAGSSAAPRSSACLAQFVSAMRLRRTASVARRGDQIEWCNARAAEHYGLDPQRDRRQRVTNLIRSPAFVAYLQAGDFDEAVSFPGPRGQGSLQVTIRRYGGDSKLVISQDQTERERTEAMRRDFVANVSHEIRTPLTVLSGFLKTMRNLPLTEVEQKRVVTLMTQQAERMANLVADLLTLARLEGSPRPPADKWVRVDTLFAHVEAEARALSAGRHAITFASAGSAQIAGSDSELLSAVGNLVSNAVRYTPDGGRIDVGWKLADNGSGEIAVVDSGRGIARAHLSRLTERFYRVDGSRSRESGGTGLGLAIVKHVMQRHGGELDIASEPDRGSSFRLVFPALRVRSAEPTAGAGGDADVGQAPATELSAR
jgi:two-component system phosphate regulon sensor histidine kinase PhoR